LFAESLLQTLRNRDVKATQFKPFVLEFQAEVQ